LGGTQGHDLEMATNCLGPFILNHLLEPILTRTAQAESTPNRVRIVWVSSMITASVPAGGIQFEENSGSPKVLKNAMQNYMQTKVGNVFLASEAAKRLGKNGIISMVG
jgi:retinol dehydrogenase 12